MPYIQFWTDIPEKISDRRIRGKLLSVMSTYERRIKNDMEVTASTFESPRAKTEFKSEYSFSSGEARIVVWTENEIWGYLDEGTEERWAVMNNPFEPKTEYRTLASYAGVRTFNKYGHYTSIRGKRAMEKRNMAPMPGIMGRRWTYQIFENRADSFELDVAEALSGEW